MESSMGYRKLGLRLNNITFNPNKVELLTEVAFCHLWSFLPIYLYFWQNTPEIRSV